MAAKHRATTAPGPGDGLVRAGAVVFVVGVLAVLADLVPFFLGHPNRPLLVNVAAFLAPVGLGIALLGLARSARQPGDEEARQPLWQHDGPPPSFVHRAAAPDADSSSCRGALRPRPAFQCGDVEPTCGSGQLIRTEAQ